MARIRYCRFIGFVTLSLWLPVSHHNINVFLCAETSAQNVFLCAETSSFVEQLVQSTLSSSATEAN